MLAHIIRFEARVVRVDTVEDESSWRRLNPFVLRRLEVRCHRREPPLHLPEISFLIRLGKVLKPYFNLLTELHGSGFWESVKKFYFPMHLVSRIPTKGTHQQSDPRTSTFDLPPNLKDIKF